MGRLQAREPDLDLALVRRELAQPATPSPTPSPTSRVAEASAPSTVPTESKEEVIIAETREKEVTLWLEKLSGERRGDRELGDWLRDGRVLCKAANAVKPGIIQKISVEQMSFKQMENIKKFTGACRDLDVLEKDVFSTVDLYEKKNLKGVQICVYNFAAIIRTTAPSFSGPYLGVQQKAVVKDEKRRAPEEPTLATGLRRDIEKEIRESVWKSRM